VPLASSSFSPSSSRNIIKRDFNIKMYY
jgi:hypothetical protein